MFTPEKIEEWIQEVEERPTSAPLIIQYIANRLRDLTEWNEQLRVENLDLRSGKRVAEYERQIADLEYQLELLKRQFDGDVPDLGNLEDDLPRREAETLNVLVYGPGGRILKFELGTEIPEEAATLHHLRGLQVIRGEPPRLLVAASTEELMFIFSSGRIATLPLMSIPLTSADAPDWEQAPIPEEPIAGESLACIVPVSRMALADFFVQVSRKAYTKKIRKALTPTIMENKYIGTGVKVPADQTLDLTLSQAGDRFALVSHEGYLQCLPAETLPYAIVEAMRLGKSDHLVAAFPIQEADSLLVMTQIGKVLQRTGESLTVASDLARKGKMLYSTARRERGVRVVGAGAAGDTHWGLALHTEGQISLHTTPSLFGSGAIPVHGELLGFVTFPGGGKVNK